MSSKAEPSRNLREQLFHSHHPCSRRTYSCIRRCWPDARRNSGNTKWRHTGHTNWPAIQAHAVTTWYKSWHSNGLVSGIIIHLGLLKSNKLIYAFYSTKHSSDFCCTLRVGIATCSKYLLSQPHWFNKTDLNKFLRVCQTLGCHIQITSLIMQHHLPLFLNKRPHLVVTQESSTFYPVIR